MRSFELRARREGNGAYPYHIKITSENSCLKAPAELRVGSLPCRCAYPSGVACLPGALMERVRVQSSLPNQSHSTLQTDSGRHRSNYVSSHGVTCLARSMLNTQQAELRRRLPALRSVDLVGGGLEVSRAEAHALSALEVGVVVLGCVVFLGALAAAVCVGCVRRLRHRKGFKTKDKDKLAGFAHAAPLTHTLHHKGPGGLYPGVGSTPASFFGLTASTSLGPGLGPGGLSGTLPHPGPALSSVGGGGDTTDTYVEMHSNKSSNCNKRRYPTSQRDQRGQRTRRSASAHHRHQHEPTCTRHKRHRHQRRPSNAQVTVASSLFKGCPRNSYPLVIFGYTNLRIF